MPVVHSKYYVVCHSTFAMMFKLCNDETFLYPVLWAAAREVFLTAKSDGAFLYLTSLNGLIWLAYQAPAFSPSSFLTSLCTSFFGELTCYCSNLPYVSQFCAFPQAMFCAGSTVSHFVVFHGLFSDLKAHFLLFSLQNLLHLSKVILVISSPIKFSLNFFFK